MVVLELGSLLFVMYWQVCLLSSFSSFTANLKPYSRRGPCSVCLINEIKFTNVWADRTNLFEEGNTSVSVTKHHQVAQVEVDAELSLRV